MDGACALVLPENHVMPTIPLFTVRTATGVKTVAPNLPLAPLAPTTILPFGGDLFENDRPRNLRGVSSLGLQHQDCKRNSRTLFPHFLRLSRRASSARKSAPVAPER